MEDNPFMFEVVFMVEKERAIKEFREFFFSTLCIWTKALILNENNLCDLLLAYSSSYLLFRCFLLYTSCVFELFTGQ